MVVRNREEEKTVGGYLRGKGHLVQPLNDQDRKKNKEEKRGYQYTAANFLLEDAVHQPQPDEQGQSAVAVFIQDDFENLRVSDLIFKQCNVSS